MKSENQESKTSDKQAKQSFDITELILEDHKDLKSLIEILKNEDSSDAELAEAFTEFKYFLTAHAKPEEEVVYNFMKSLKAEELKLMALEGDVEHTLADQLVEESVREDDKLKFRAKVKVLAEIVEHHIEEEEEEILPKLSKEVDLQTRKLLADQYLELRADYLAKGKSLKTSRVEAH